MKGRATIDIAVDVLRDMLVMMPSSYGVIGSESSGMHGVVRLVVESDDINPDRHDIHLTGEVKDAGSTRTVVLYQCDRPCANLRL